MSWVSECVGGLQFDPIHHKKVDSQWSLMLVMLLMHGAMMAGGKGFLLEESLEINFMSSSQVCLQ